MFATAYTDSSSPNVPTEVWEMDVSKFPQEQQPEPGLYYWLSEEDGKAVVKRHEMHDRVWTAEEIEEINRRAQEMMRLFSPANERMSQWVASNCSPEGAEFVEHFQLDNPERAFTMLRYQVRDVAQHTGATTADLKELYRIALEEVASQPRGPNFPNMALQHLTNMNPYGVNENGEVPLAQCRDGEEPEFVEWVFVQDILEQF